MPPIGDSPSQVVNRLAIGDTIYLAQKHAARHNTARLERDLRALLAISTTINALTTEDDLHQQLLELLVSTLPAEQVAIVTADANGEARVVGARQVGASRPVAVNRTVFTQAMQDRVSLMTREALGDVEAAGDSPTASSILCVPLVVRDRALGALYLTARADAFDTDHLQFATAVANVVGGRARQRASCRVAPRANAPACRRIWRAIRIWSAAAPRCSGSTRSSRRWRGRTRPC